MAFSLKLGETDCPPLPALCSRNIFPALFLHALLKYMILISCGNSKFGAYKIMVSEMLLCLSSVFLSPGPGKSGFSFVISCVCPSSPIPIRQVMFDWVAATSPSICLCYGSLIPQSFMEHSGVVSLFKRENKISKGQVCFSAKSPKTRIKWCKLWTSVMFLSKPLL